MERKGYIILEKNYRNKFGEIDIIAYHETEEKLCSLVYVEIKYRKGTGYGDPLEAVDYRKQGRISRAASYHYAQNGTSKGLGCRFDVIAIYGDGHVTHIENAFDYMF